MKSFNKAGLYASVGGAILAFTHGTGAVAAAQELPGEPASDVQEVEPEDATLRNEVIVVTAQKREESLLETALAVTAIGQNGLDSFGIQDTADLSTIVPNLQVADAAGDSWVSLTVRGISTSNITDLGNPAVAFHVDGVYLGRPVAINQLLYDVERVEVLRGPQGTLYGRGATAGSLNVLSARPEFDEMSGRAEFTYGNYDNKIAKGVFNMPVSDTLAFRVSGTYGQNDGFQRTQGTAGRVDTTDSFAVRAGMLWEPIDPLSVYLTFDRFESDALPSYAPIVAVNGAPAPTADVRNRPVNTAGYATFEQSNYRANISYDLSDYLSLTYLGGYSEGARDSQFSPDASLGDSSINTIGATYESQSHELDLNFGGAGSPISGVVGLFYWKDKADNSRFSIDIPTGGLSIVLLSDYADQESKAVFGQVTFDVTSDLSITGGARYAEDKMAAVDFHTYICAFPTSFDQAGVPPCFVDIDNSRDGKWSATTWRLAADYQINDDLFTYASVSTGYKPGGFGDAGTPTFDPENVTNYEVGLKGQFLDGALTGSLAMFYMDYSDLQVSVGREVSPGVRALFTENAAKAENLGAEFEYTWQLSPNDRISGYIATIDATYKEYIAAPDQFALTGLDVDLSGNKLIRTPGLSQQFRYEHIFDFSSGATLTPSASIYWQDEMYLREYNVDATDREKGYTRTDLLLTYRAPADAWFAEAFVRNLEDNDVRNSMGTADGLLTATYSAPRTYGARIGFEF